LALPVCGNYWGRTRGGEGKSGKKNKDMEVTKKCHKKMPAVDLSYRGRERLQREDVKKVLEGSGGR